MTDQTLAQRLAAEILAEVGEGQMGECYAALPDLIHDLHEPYASMSQAEREALVQAVAETDTLGGEGYVYDYPVH